MNDLGDVHYFLGVQVTHTPDILIFSQHKYVQNLLRKFHLHTLIPLCTPIAAKTKLSLNDGELLADPSVYRSMIGALKYLTITRPDIAFVVHVVFQFIHAPCTTHLLAVERVYRYLQGTSDHGLSLRKAIGSTRAIANSDADWADCLDSSRSTSGYAVFFGPNLISWHSKMQPTVLRSSTEAEYRALAYTVAETLWLRRLLVELGIVLRHPVTLFGDNISATYITANLVLHDRSKHINVDYHFVRERVAHGDLVVRYVPTQLQLADIFTKGLSSQRFLCLRNNLSISTPLLEYVQTLIPLPSLFPSS
ncbi:uncharacterized protein LOC109847086 [Asparagus officinalis]|uniref:uncharacterized protein LOC109847086 n=1 Tax=Asparagus officinalis TaxID=4686 RepID=UPI00098E5010|nr:uncharacterized protein LOC109847086 [Asparagus officinalis]